MVWLKPQAGQTQGEGGDFGIDFIDRRLYWEDTLVLMEDLAIYNTTKSGTSTFFSRWIKRWNEGTLLHIEC